MAKKNSIVTGLGLSTLIWTGRAEAQVTVVDFDNAISLANMQDQACDTVAYSPYYSEPAGITDTGWTPTAQLRPTGGFEHYHLGFEDTRINCQDFNTGCFGTPDSRGVCQPLPNFDYNSKPRYALPHQAGAVLELILDDGGRNQQMNLLGIQVRDGNLNIKGYQPDGSYWNWFIGQGYWNLTGLNKYLTRITFEGYNASNPSFDDIMIESAYTSHNFSGQNSRGYSGDGNWQSSYYKGECESDRALVGISSNSQSLARTLRCKSHLFPAVTNGVTLDFASSNARRSTTYGNWDSGYYKGECADDEVVIGVSQSTSTGKLKSLRCAKYTTAANPAPATGCAARPLGTTGAVYQDVTNWDPGNTRTECGDQGVVKGVSRDTTTGALHKILCCSYPGVSF